MTGARQNIILELGFFVAKLSRQRVCAPKRSNVDTPSDYAGFAHADLDNGDSWKMQLVQERHACGFNVDTNRVVSE